MVRVLTALSNGSVLVFVVTTMLAMGLGLTPSQILAPLRQARLVVTALVANSVLVPLLSVALTRIIPLSEPLKIGLILLGVAAGAPFLPKLAQVAHGNVAFSVALMTLLTVVTIIALPLDLPLLLPGVRVNPLSIVLSLVLTMLLPLGIALLFRARYPDQAEQLLPVMTQASNAALVLLLVTSLLASFQQLIGLIGTGGILAALLLIGGGVVIGYLLGGPGGDTRSVLGLGTGQRNIAAALLVATQSSSDPEVLAMVLAGSTLGLFVLLPLASEIGRRAAHRATTAGGAKDVLSSTTGPGAAAPAAADLPPAGPAPAPT